MGEDVHFTLLHISSHFKHVPLRIGGIYQIRWWCWHVGMPAIDLPDRVTLHNLNQSCAVFGNSQLFNLQSLHTYITSREQFCNFPLLAESFLSSSHTHCPCSLSCALLKIFGAFKSLGCGFTTPPRIVIWIWMSLSIKRRLESVHVQRMVMLIFVHHCITKNALYPIHIMHI